MSPTPSLNLHHEAKRKALDASSEGAASALDQGVGQPLKVSELSSNIRSGFCDFDSMDLTFQYSELHSGDGLSVIGSEAGFVSIFRFS